MKKLFLIMLLASFMGVTFGQVASLGKVGRLAGSRDKARVNAVIDMANVHQDSLEAYATNINTGTIDADSINLQGDLVIDAGVVDIDSTVTLQNGATLTNPHADTVVITEAVVTASADVYVTDDIVVTDDAAVGGDLTLTGGLISTPTVTEYTTIVTIDSTKIAGNDAGDIGHADGAILVAAAGTGYALEFVSAVLIYDHSTADFAGGGDDVVIQVGVNGNQITSSGAVTGANLLEASGDKMLRLGCIATELVPVDNSAISIAGTALTNDAGTAAGQLRVHLTYRKHTTGL